MTSIRKDKKGKALLAAKLLSFFVPLVEGIGLTGSVASGQVSEDDDLDFLIITHNNLVFTTRFCCYLLAFVLGKKRTKRNEKNKWCMNIFLDEDFLLVPEEKRSKFSASQLVKMIALYDRGGCFNAFYNCNNFWVKQLIGEDGKYEYKHDGNNVVSEKIKDKKGHKVIWLEELMRRYQMKYMKKKMTNEYVSEKQIFFHPNKREEIV